MRHTEESLIALVRDYCLFYDDPAQEIVSEALRLAIREVLAEPVAKDYGSLPTDLKVSADWLESWNKKKNPGGPGWGFTSAVGVMRRAYCAMTAAPPSVQAEPVAWVYELKDWESLIVSKDILRRPNDAIPLYDAPPADDEAVRLLREARQCVHKEASDEREIEGRGYYCDLASRIDTYLARVKK